ncbi:MAG: hypothetical protein SPG74_06655 [Eubacteriales bacterium]|nr:hypothetical protein [Eubacteriales bacterium]
MKWVIAGKAFFFYIQLYHPKWTKSTINQLYFHNSTNKVGKAASKRQIWARMRAGDANAEAERRTAEQKPEFSRSGGYFAETFLLVPENKSKSCCFAGNFMISL